MSDLRTLTSVCYPKRHGLAFDESMAKTVSTAVLWFMAGWTLGNVVAIVASLPWVVVPAIAATTVGVFVFVVAPRTQRPVG